jgi:hypothetical protein
MIFSFEAERGHKDLLLRARGEQFIDLVRSEEWRRSIFSEVAPGLPKGAWSKEQQYRAGLALVQKFTGPQLVGLLDPLSLEARSQFPFGDDPPAIKIIAPVLLPFFLVGFWSLWRRGRRHVGFTCAIVGTVGAIPLLFTTRVDTYRAIFLIVPLSICITAGLSEFIQIARRCKVPRTIVCLGFLAAMICGIAPRTQDMYQPQVEESLQQTAIVSTLRAISGPVVVVSQIDHKIEALIHMELFARLRRTRQASDFFEDHMANFLTDGEIDNAPVIVDKISRVVERGAVAMLVPSRSYKILAAKLQNAGYVVRTGRASNLPYWLVTKANVKLDPQVGEVTRLDTSIITPPLAATQDFVSHNPVYLSDLTPLEASYDFAPMNIGRSYSGQPVRWRNLGFLHGIGTHATTDLVYKVPNNSEGFQSWVGISSGVETCAKGSAQVVLSDQDGTRLYESPVLYAEANPIFISIPIPNVTSLRVHISNAGDGRDCDHVDLGDPAFMIPKSE